MNLVPELCLPTRFGTGRKDDYGEYVHAFVVSEGSSRLFRSLQRSIDTIARYQYHRIPQIMELARLTVFSPFALLASVKGS